MKRLFILAVLLTGATSAYASRNITIPVANETGLAYNKNFDLDISNYNLDSLSLQVVYSSAAFSTKTFTDGTASTGSITVVSTQPLVGLQGSGTVTVFSNSLPTNAIITVNGYQIFAGGDWAIADVSSNTAVNIKNAVNNYSTYLGVTASTTAATVVTLTCNNVGAFCNSNTLAVNTSSLTVTAFSGGVDHAKFCINGTCLTEGTDWNVVSTASGTAKNISDAIVGNSTLNTIISSTWSAAGVVTSTSTGVGASANYSLWCRPQASLQCFSVAYKGGTDSAIVTGSSSLNLTSNGYTTALPVLYRKTAGTSPGTLVGETTYYAIIVDANNIKLASSSSNAQAGTSVAITTQTATGAGSFSLIPLAYAGTVVIKLQTSNDGTTFTDSPYAVTYSSSIASSTKKSVTWNLNTPAFQTARVAVTGPTQGGLALSVTARGRTSTR